MRNRKIHLPDRKCQKCGRECFGKLCRKCYLSPKLHHGSKVSLSRQSNGVKA